MAAQLANGRPRAYLDLDVDDAYAQFKRASHFVESCDLKYALSSKKIDELGGGEILRLPELYSTDFEWHSKGPMRARPPPAEMPVGFADWLYALIISSTMRDPSLASVR